MIWMVAAGIGRMFGLFVWLAFVAAQGGAVFLTALVAAQLLRTQDWAAKTALMTVSYLAWILFTWAIFFSGADVYILFFPLCFSAAVSSGLFWLGWIFIPVLEDRIRSRRDTSEATS